MICSPLRTYAFGLFMLATACSAQGVDGPAGTTEDEITICGPTDTEPPPDPCAYHLTRLADATIYMGAGVTEDTVQVGAPTQASCPSNVIDVKIPSNSSPDPDDCEPSGCYPTVEMVAGAGSFTGSGEAPDFSYLRYPETESACESFWLSARLYQKSSRASTFSFVKKYKYRGFWKGGYCSVETVCGACETNCTKTYFPDDLYAPYPPDGGVYTYRIVTYAKAHDAYVASRVIAGYEPQ